MNIKLLILAAGIVACISIVMGMMSIAASSSNVSDSNLVKTNDAVQSLESFLQTFNVGASAVLSNGMDITVTRTASPIDLIPVEDAPPEGIDSLVMANVNNSLNVRSEPDEDSKLAGKLYKDCGGQIIERKNGWTMLKSGDLVGWAKDEYLLFGQDAKVLASDVGTTVAVVDAETLRVRKEPSSAAKVWGLLAKSEEVMVDEEVVKDGEWVAVDFEGGKGYVASEFVHINFSVDEGETIESIKQRELEVQNAKAKAALNRKYAAETAASATDLELLAALIQCEAGNQPAEGQLAVGAVVMNRVRSGAYPSTIYGVIFASGQFGPASNGRLAKTLEKGAKESCRIAAQLAIDGNSNVGALTHFRRKGSKSGIEIGDHVFY